MPGYSVTPGVTPAASARRLADRDRRQPRRELAGLGLERREVLARDRSRAHGHELARIDEGAVLPDPEVQMRPGREAGGADVADHGLGGDMLADLEAVRELAEVHVRGL